MCLQAVFKAASAMISAESAESREVLLQEMLLFSYCCKHNYIIFVVLQLSYDVLPRARYLE